MPSVNINNSNQGFESITKSNSFNRTKFLEFIKFAFPLATLILYVLYEVNL